MNENYNNPLEEMHHQSEHACSFENVVGTIEKGSEIERLKRKKKKLRKKIKKMKKLKKKYGLTKEEKKKLVKLKRKLLTVKSDGISTKALSDEIYQENLQYQKERLAFAILLLENNPDREKIMRDLSIDMIKNGLKCSLPKRTFNIQPKDVVEGDWRYIDDNY